MLTHGIVPQKEICKVGTEIDQSSCYRKVAASSLPSRGYSACSFPVVEGRLADPVLAAQMRRLHAVLAFLQDRDDLPFAMPLALHRPFVGQDSSSPRIKGNVKVRPKSQEVECSGSGEWGNSTKKIQSGSVRTRNLKSGNFALPCSSKLLV